MKPTELLNFRIMQIQRYLIKQDELIRVQLSEELRSPVFKIVNSLLEYISDLMKLSSHAFLPKHLQNEHNSQDRDIL